MKSEERRMQDECMNPDTSIIAPFGSFLVGLAEQGIRTRVAEALDLLIFSAIIRRVIDSRYLCIYNASYQKEVPCPVLLTANGASP